jgi:hypothetical protein
MVWNVPFDRVIHRFIHRLIFLNIIFLVCSGVKWRIVGYYALLKRAFVMRQFKPPIPKPSNLPNLISP